MNEKNRANRNRSRVDDDEMPQVTTKPIEAEGAATSSPIHDEPLSPQRLREMEQAKQRGKRIRRAARAAVWSGWSMSIFAGVTMLFGFLSLTSLLLGAALFVIARIEFVGARRLRQLDPRGAGLLGFNQIALFVLMAVYGGWSIYRAIVAPSPYAAQIAQGGQIAEMLGPLDELGEFITIAVYATVIVVSAVMQGVSAWRRFRLRRRVEEFARSTPRWILDLLRTDCFH